ncbi:hypothetical protein Taro_012136, partial [Colocasia esculenta]|nr:hypothetical protein [Colocasia esculenta]
LELEELGMKLDEAFSTRILLLQWKQAANLWRQQGKYTPDTPSSFPYSSACPPRRRASPAGPIAFFLILFGAGDWPLSLHVPRRLFSRRLCCRGLFFCKVVGRLIAEGESVTEKVGTLFRFLCFFVSLMVGLQVAKKDYNIKMGRRKRFTVVDSKEDREDSPKKKTGPSCDTDAKKVFVGCDSINAFKGFLKIAYEGKEMRAVADELKVIDLHVLKVPQQKGSTECGFMVLYFIFCFILAAPTSFDRNDYPSFLTADWFSREEYEKFREDLQGKIIHIDAQSASTSKQFLKIGATLDRGDLFIRTRMKKAGGPVNEESAAMIDKIRDIKLTQQSNTSSSIASVGDAYEQVMGRDRTGRICGIGTGPALKSLWGSRSEQKMCQDNESLKEKIDALEERMKKIESRGNNEDSLAGRRVRILNFFGEVVANGILMSDDDDNVVMGNMLGVTQYGSENM